MNEQEILNYIQKAVTAGDLPGFQSVGGTNAQALKTEDLDRVIRSIERNLDQIQFAKLMPKRTRNQNNFRYVIRDSHGDRDHIYGGFHGEAETPEVQTGQFTTDFGNLKYMHETGSVTLLSQEVQMIANAKLEEQQSRLTNMLLKDAKRKYFADSKVNDLAYDGVYPQHYKQGVKAAQWATLEQYYDEVVIDLRGSALTPDDVRNAATLIHDNGNGRGTHLFSDSGVIEGLSQNLGDKDRFIIGDGNVERTANIIHKTVATMHGNVQMVPEVFANRETPKDVTTNATNATKAPAAPTATSVVAVANDPQSKYVATDALGSVFYAVSAINGSGESSLTVLPDASTASTVAAGASNDLTFTSTGGANITTGFKIYRTEVTTQTTAGTLKFYPIATISLTELAQGYDGAAAGSFRDRGRVLPNVGDGFLIEMDTQTIEDNILTSPKRIDFALTELAERFIIVKRDSPLLYAPKRMIKFVNCQQTIVPRSSV